MDKQDLIPYPQIMDALRRITDRAEYKSKFAATRATRKENKAILDFNKSIMHYLNLRYAKGNIQSGPGEKDE
jgi:hypothetical protein